MEMSQASFNILAKLITKQTGQQLTDSRRWRVDSALAGVLSEHGIDNIDQLVCLLDTDSHGTLTKQVVDALLNNETYFFRDKPTFDQLPKDILPLLAERRRTKRKLRIWSAGCSTGQEVHSLAIEFAEKPALWANWSIDILGTDISEKAISAARAGLYNQFDVQRGLSVVQMLKYFDDTPNGWSVTERICRSVRFAKHNVLEQPPETERFDLILCRNVLLYFDAQTRTQVFDRLSNALAPDGFLMLGAGETVLGRTSKFSAAGKRPSVFEPVTGKTQDNLTVGQAAALRVRQPW